MRITDTLTARLLITLCLGVVLGLIAHIWWRGAILLLAASCIAGPVVVALLVGGKASAWGFVPSPIMSATVALLSLQDVSSGHGVVGDIVDIFILMSISAACCFPAWFVIYLRQKV